MASDEVGQRLQGGQDQVGGPQVPLLGNGDEIDSSNWVRRYNRVVQKNSSMFELSRPLSAY